MSFEQHNHALKIDFTKEKPKPVTLVGRLKHKLDDLLWYKDFTKLLPYRWQIRYYDKIKPIFVDKQKRIRKSIPRTWCDISHLMVDVNFEMIKKFYEEEYKADIVDWEASGPEHVEFIEWLEWAYTYITKERPAYEKAMWNAYPPHQPSEKLFEPCEFDEKGKAKMYKMVKRKETYEERYGEVNRLEQLIEGTDTQVLIEFVEYRGFFWT